MDDFKIHSLSGRIESIYIKIIKKTKTKEELDIIKDLYIIKNPFVLLNEKRKYLGYINRLNRHRYMAHIFITNFKKTKERREKIDKILANFVNIVKYKILEKKNPCNDTDLYTLDEYDKNNKNIYVIDIKNTKWWFTIETICKLICNNLSHFDSETHNVLCKEPINPFINNKFNIGQLIGIYEQLYKFKSVPNLFMLYRMANFNINQFLRIYNSDIINYSYKYKLIELDDESILTILNTVFNDNSIHYTNVYKLNLSNISIRNDVIQIIKFCIIQIGNNKKEIRKFINKYYYILKKALRPNIDNETELDLSDNETELDLSDNENELDLSDNETELDFSNNETELDFSNNENELDFSNNENELDFSNNETELDFSNNETELNLSENELNYYDNELDYYDFEETYIIDEVPNNYLIIKAEENSYIKIKAYMEGYIVRQRIRELKNIINKLRGYFMGYIERRRIKYENI